MRWVFIICAAALALVISGSALAAPPGNDAFANATVVGSLPFSDLVDVTEATTEPGEPYAGCYQAVRSVWYSITPAHDTVVQVSTAGSSFWDQALAAYRDTSSGIAGLQSLGCASSGSPLNVHLQGGQTYLVQAGSSFYTAGGTLNLSMTEIPAPPNDGFANAAAVGSLPYSDTQNSTAATLESGEPSPSCGPGAPDSLWYAFTAPSTGPYTVRTQYGGWPTITLYRGVSLGSLTEIDCAVGGGAARTFSATAGQLTFIRVSEYYVGNVVGISVDHAPNPTADFWFWPGDPTSYDTLSFQDNSYDPGGNTIVESRFEFGDGTSAVRGPNGVTHRYAKDGDYSVRLTATTSDGRTGTATRVVQVRTHDVAITKLTVPQTAHVGQSRTVTVSVGNTHYAENVTVYLYRSVVGGGFEQVGTLTQGVPPRSNRATDFSILYTFTAADATAEKVTFKATAVINGARDAISGDNEVVALPTRVT